MNFTGSINSSDAELFTLALLTIAETTTNSEDALDSSVVYWTTEAMTIRASTVMDSYLEQVITVSLLMFFWVYVNITNGFLLHIIRNDHSLHTPQYTVLALYMVGDTVYFNSVLLLMVPVDITNNIYVFPTAVSQVLLQISLILNLSATHMIGLIAVERYGFFITPLRYTRRFTKTRILISVVFIYLFSLCMGVAVYVIEPLRVDVESMMTYQVSGEAIVNTNILYTVVYIIPSGLISVITLIRLRLLISKHRSQIAQLPNADCEQQSAVNGIIINPMKKAIKMICLVSGCFWLTTMPAALIKNILPVSTNHQATPALKALSKATHMMLYVMTSVLNPIIYVSMQTDLRKSIWKYIGVNGNNS